MKTTLALIPLVCLAVSCSHTKPAFQNYQISESPGPAATETTPPPAHPMTEETVAPIVPAPALVETNAPAVAAAAVPAPEPAIPNAPIVTPSAPFVRAPRAAVPAPPAPVTPAPSADPGGDQVISAGMVDFRGADLNQVLTLYCDMVGRTLLRPQALPDPKIILKNQTQLTKSEMIQAFDAVLALNGITMIKIGDKFVKAVPVGQAQQEGAPLSRLDSADLPELGQYVTHVVQLTNAKPSEMVQVLQPFAKIPNSILPIDSSGILVIRDYTENVKRMLEMIKQVDVPLQSEYISEVIPIKYALAADIASALNSLSSGGGGTTVGGSGSSSSGGLAGGRTGIGGTGMGGTGIGGGAGGIGGTTQPGGRTYPGSTVNRLGSATTPGGGANPGGGGQGTSFTDRLRSIINRTAPGATGSGEIQVIGQTKIIADERTNSLLIFASREDMAMIKDIVKKLDVVLAQVLIEAIIMEVSLDDSRNIGVSAGQATKRFGNNLGAGGMNNGQPFFPFTDSGGSNSFPGNFSSVLPANNFTYWGRLGGSIDVSLQAIASNGRVNVLSRPRIQTSHGVEADLFVGQTVPYITGTTFGDFAGVSSRSQYQEKQIGITLKVKPLINPDGLVVMDIYQEIGQPGATPVVIDGNPVPIINQRQASAQVAVKDHDTIILGGMIGTTKNKTRSGIPFLKDIPMLGYLFRSTSDSEQRTELIVLLRPTVLPTPEAAAMVAKAERNNLPGVRRAEAEIRAEETERIKRAEKDLDRKTGSPKTGSSDADGL